MFSQGFSVVRAASEGGFSHKLNFMANQENE
jgi:hypothetical protein